MRAGASGGDHLGASHDVDAAVEHDEELGAVGTLFGEHRARGHLDRSGQAADGRQLPLREAGEQGDPVEARVWGERRNMVATPSPPGDDLVS